ncbi:MAG: hypothetical protein JKY37_09675 [Nannocystaceae bacterium]|nr:hypothetical protein [Nannocystaceae bacterium]
MHELRDKQIPATQMARSLKTFVAPGDRVAHGGLANAGRPVDDDDHEFRPSGRSTRNCKLTRRPSSASNDVTFGSF